MKTLPVLILFAAVLIFSAESKHDKAKRDFGFNRNAEEIERTCDKVAKYKARANELMNKIRNKLVQLVKDGESLFNKLEGHLNSNTKPAKPLGFKINRTRVHKKHRSIHEINRLAGVECVIRGDIVPTEAQIDLLTSHVEAELKANTTTGSKGGRKRRGAAFKSSTYPQTLWPKKPASIPYYFDASIDAPTRALIVKSLQWWGANSCVQFAQNATSTARKIRFFKGSGCWSYVGRVAGTQASQDISIGDGCEEIGTITHEVGHALGFFHEQSRVDRDSFLKLDLTNVDPAMVSNYRKETTATNYNFGITYDYGSIMQYDEFSFAKDSSKPVMHALQPGFQRTMGSRVLPSLYDVKMMNLLYQCPSPACAAPPACKIGGIASPVICSNCICPSGFGGPLCDKRQPASDGNATCGGAITVTGTYTQYKLELTSPWVEASTFRSCWWWLTAPAGKRVQIQVMYVGDVGSDGCAWGFSELKMGFYDWARTGYRLCTEGDFAGYPVYTSGNPANQATGNKAMIGLYTRYGDQRIVFNARYVSW